MQSRIECPTKAMMWANRNGYFYVLDRTTVKYLLGRAYVRVNWSSGLDENCRPIPTPQPEGMPTLPGNQGGTNWYPPSFSPRTGLFYFSAWEDYAIIYVPEEQEYEPGQAFLGGSFSVLAPVTWMEEGVQYVSVISGHALYTFSLRERRRPRIRGFEELFECPEPRLADRFGSE